MTLRRRDDRGMTITELSVTMLVFAIVSAVTLGIISSLTQQSVNLKNSNAAAQQEIIGSEALQPFIHSALTVQKATSTEFAFVAYSGFNYSTSGTGAGTATCVLVDSKWTPKGSGQATARFTITTQPADCSTAVVTTGTKPVTVATYAALNSQTTPVFQYLNSAGTVIGPNPPCTATEIYAAIVNITYLAGPQTATQGFASNRASTLYAEVYFQPESATTTTNPATTTTTLASTCS